MVPNQDETDELLDDQEEYDELLEIAEDGRIFRKGQTPRQPAKPTVLRDPHGEYER